VIWHGRPFVRDRQVAERVEPHSIALPVPRASREPATRHRADDISIAAMRACKNRTGLRGAVEDRRLGVYTDRDTARHIISARLASRKERKLWQSFAEHWKASGA
jgi:hypothetical protein